MLDDTPHASAHADVRCSLRRGDLVQAEAGLRAALASAEGRARAALCLQLALVLMRQARDGRPAQAPAAVQCLLGAIAADPTWEEAYVRALRHLRHLPDPRLARDVARQGLEYHPRSAALRGYAAGDER
jgi:hypothetical protein